MSRARSTRQPKRQRPERPSPFHQQEEEGARHGAATAIDRLTLLSQELLICVLKYLEDYSDCARFSLASPRLGLTALQNGLQLPRFQHPRFAVAMRLITMETGGRKGMRSSTLARRAEARARSMLTTGSAHSRFAEAWVRKYVADDLASPDDFEWIKASSPELYIAQSTLYYWHMTPNNPCQRWNLVRGGVPDAKVRMKLANSTVQYYEGEKGAEHCTRAEDADGMVKYYEGEQGAERRIRTEFADGTVGYYEGERGAERRLRLERADGTVHYYEGERGAEHLVRLELADGTVMHYEGKKGAERRLRIECADGTVRYYEGERGAERLVRTELADGTVGYYEGKKGAERRLRLERADGTVHYYEGERGAERLVRTELADGTVMHYEGKKDAERRLRIECADGTVHYYEGEQGAERAVRTEFAEQRCAVLRGQEGCRAPPTP
eukprot:SAG25_NODE_219_length_11644_cov_21.713729_1_plen_440_part_00